MKKLLTVLTVICMAAGCAAGIAEGAVVEEKALELAGSSLRFPAVSGMADGDLQEAVNVRIREDLDVEGYLQRMNAVISDDTRSITVNWEGGIAGDVFSALLDAESAVANLPGSYAWTCSSVDLRDGHEITFGELFTDEAAAREALESYLEETAAPELSPHLGNSALTPLPEMFMIRPTGLTMLYDAKCTPQTARNRLGSFKFSGEDVFKRVQDLSGGEKSRLKLCILMGETLNLLILDEPTNHLDIASREWIEQALEAYEGTLIFVSHDRYFTNRFATRIWELAGGTIRDFRGTYDEYRAKYARPLPRPAEKKPAEAKAPKPVREKPARPRNAERTLARLEKQIADQEALLAKLGQEIQENATDYVRLSELQETSERENARLEELMDQWMELAEQTD